MVAVPSFLLSWVLTNPPSSRFASHVEFAFYSSPTRAWEFAVGSLLALWRVDYLRLRSSRLARLCTGFVGASGALLVFFAAVLYSNETVFPGPSALVPVVGTCCLIYAGGEHHGIWGRLLANRVLVSLGNVSYSWYLWHWPFIVFGRALFPGTTWVAVPSAILSLGPAWFSLKMIENPIRFAVAPTKRNPLFTHTEELRMLGEDDVPALGAQRFTQFLYPGVVLSAGERVRAHDLNCRQDIGQAATVAKVW